LPIIINAANDWATMAFKNGNIKFVEIIQIINQCIVRFKNIKIDNIRQVFQLNDRIISYLNNLQK
jgi:1-deoxy-D-xylulose-5-phosphate reductoisomerase